MQNIDVSEYVVDNSIILDLSGKGITSVSQLSNIDEIPDDITVINLANNNLLDFKEMNRLMKFDLIIIDNNKNLPFYNDLVWQGHGSVGVLCTITRTIDIIDRIEDYKDLISEWELDLDQIKFCEMDIIPSVFYDLDEEMDFIEVFNEGELDLGSYNQTTTVTLPMKHWVKNKFLLPLLEALKNKKIDQIITWLNKVEKNDFGIRMLQDDRISGLPKLDIISFEEARTNTFTNELPSNIYQEIKKIPS